MDHYGLGDVVLLLVLLFLLVSLHWPAHTYKSALMHDARDKDLTH
jgi:hypothetical protein